MSPHITATAIDARNAAPEPLAKMAGSIPVTIAIVVIMIGLARSLPESISACKCAMP